MASLFYFLEGVTADELVTPQRRLEPAVLADHGLAQVLADVRDVPDHCIVTPTAAGPSNSPGVLLFPVTLDPHAHPQNPSYDPAAQLWTHDQSGNRKGPAPWLGSLRDSPPRPEDLHRRRQLPGYTVTDGHGRAWSVPILRGLDRAFGTLPTDYAWPEDLATPRLQLRDEFAALWDDSAKVWDYCYVEGGVYHDLPETWLASFVARCLAINHRIGPLELNRLGALGLAPFDRSNLTDFCAAAVDVQAVLEYVRTQKKTPPLPTPDSKPSPPGTPAAIPTGDPPAAN